MLSQQFFFIFLCRCASENRELFMYKRLFPGKSRSVLKKACIGVRAGDGGGGAAAIGISGEF